MNCQHLRLLHMLARCASSASIAFPVMSILAIGISLLSSSPSAAQERTLPSFPLVRQPDDISCGAASAAMVLKYYGINAGVGPIKTDAGTQWLAIGGFKVGMTLPKGLRSALVKRGVDSQVRTVSLNDLMNIVRDGRPAVLLVRSSATTWHWFVVYGYRGNGNSFRVSDPAGQQYWISAKMLDQAMRFSHDTDGRPTGDRKCATCGGDGQMTNLDCPTCDGGWIKEKFTGFKTKCPAGCNGGRITARCQVCNGSGNSPDMYRKAVETAGVSGHTAVVPRLPPQRAGGSGGSSLAGDNNGGNVIKYTITNETKQAVTLTFSPSGNTQRLVPKQTISARSPVQGESFPKVKATTSNGKWWERTIREQGGAYRIVKRGESGVQIVP